MNYITEINVFYQRQETNPLSSHAANLWHTLMHINNRAGWIKKFTVSVSVLCSKSNLTNSTFKLARIELRDKGYIRYESRSGNQAAIYQILSAEESNMDQNNAQNADANQTDHKDQTNMQTKNTHDLDHKAVPLVKQKEIKQRTSTTAVGAIDFFQKNIGKIGPYMKSDLIKWVNDVGEPLVIAAMKRTLERGKENWGYIKAILQNWLEKGIKTVEDSETEIFTLRKKQGQKTTKPRNREIIPDWFYTRNQNEVKPMIKCETAAEAKEREEIDDLLAAYVNG